MNAIFSDPALAKTLVMVLIGLIGVLCLAVLYLAIKKNQIIYVEKEGQSVERKEAPVEKVEPVAVSTPVVPVTPEEPLVVEPDFERSKELGLLNLTVDEEEESTETKVVPMVNDVVYEEEKEEVGRSLAGYANQVITGLDISIMIKDQTAHAKVTSFPCLLGRETGKCDVVVSEPAVSRKHARFILIDGDPYVEDVSEHNGTYLNEMKLPPLGKARVHEGDVIVLGRAKIRVNQYLYE